MSFYDAHNHLQDERLTSSFAGGGGIETRPVSRRAILEEAMRAGVTRMVVNGSCEEDWPGVQELAREFSMVIPSFGYHPWYLTERTERWREALAEALRHPGAVVGEIGLDRWKPGLPYDHQEEVFLTQLQMAAERNVAASIHCLQAWGRLHEMLLGNPRPARGFLLHSYGGSKEMVEPLTKLGAYFSFPGYYIHERKARQREAFRAVPLERLLIETDAPDQLLPAAATRFPLRDRSGQPLNHPANLAAIYEFAARERGMALGEFAGQIESNFTRLFAY